ncbi:MAG: nickel pincer cofactor biosynthesis protein LarB [Planctomycetota bacterium]
MNHEDQKSIKGATVDLGRAQRCGFGEVVYGEGKSPELIAEILQTQKDIGQPGLVTRLDPKAAQWLQERFPEGRHHTIARTFRLGGLDGQLDDSQLANRSWVAVLSAGSTDEPIAAEAAETLSWMEVKHKQFRDVGVAGPQRLQAVLPDLQKASALVVVAGMEGALASVIGGHIRVPVFAVPTSVGYGASFGGVAALLGMLTSCVAGVSVVNIDAGFKAAYNAGLVVSMLEQAAAEDT